MILVLLMHPSGMTGNMAPDDNYWVWHKEGDDENNPDKLYFPLFQCRCWDVGPYGQIEILPEDLVGSTSLSMVMGVINDMSQYGDFIPNNHDRGATTNCLSENMGKRTSHLNSNGSQ